MFVIDVARTSTSCGYGAPVMSLVRNRQLEDRGRKYKASKDAPAIGVRVPVTGS